MQQRKNRSVPNIAIKIEPLPVVVVKPSGLQFTAGAGRHGLLVTGRGEAMLVSMQPIGGMTRPNNPPFPPGTKVSEGLRSGLGAWFRRLEKQYAID